jgi:hypothetical protein
LRRSPGAGDCPSPPRELSPAPFRALRCARMAQDGRTAPVLLFTASPIGVGRKRRGRCPAVGGSSLVIEALRELSKPPGGPVSCPLPRSYCPRRPPSLPAANCHIIHGDALPRSGTPTPVGPGRSGSSLRRVGVMAMLRGCGAGTLLHGVCSSFPIWSRFLRPEKSDTLSGLFSCPQRREDTPGRARAPVLVLERRRRD